MMEMNGLVAVGSGTVSGRRVASLSPSFAENTGTMRLEDREARCCGNGGFHSGCCSGL